MRQVLMRLFVWFTVAASAAGSTGDDKLRGESMLRSDLHRMTLADGLGW
jgi:hypothetical protein